MSALPQRPIRTVLIPWVMALTALIGAGALVPDHARSRKSESSGELELTQPADIAHLAYRISHGQFLLDPHHANETGLLDPPSRLVLIGDRAARPAFGFEGGTIRGRAPPLPLPA